MTTTIPALPLNTIQNGTDSHLLRFGASLRGKKTEDQPVWTPRNAHEAQAMLENSQEDATPAAVFYSPSTWLNEYQLLTRNVLQKDDFVALYHNYRTFQLKGKIKMSCFVRNVPRLSALKAAIQAESSISSSYDVWNPSTSATQTRKSRQRVMVDVPPPTIWAVSAVRDSEIYVFDALSGSPLLCFRDMKYNVGVTAISHAPFMGLINKQLQVIPVEYPQDLLPLKEQHLIDSDYMWIGFADGAIRLFPANHDQFFPDLSPSSHGAGNNHADITDVAFEVPKYHAGAIVSVVRSPSLEAEDGVDLSTVTRLSSTMKAMRAATQATKEEYAHKRDHLSLVCTASVDSVVVVWDVKKIYQSLQQIREKERKERSRTTTTYTSSTATFAQEVTTVEQLSRKGKPVLPGLKMTSKLRCILIKVRPLLRLKGGVPGITCLNWVSSLVTTEGYRPEREPEKVTRDPVEPSAPEVLKARREVQTTTRFERREDQRRALDLTEEEMGDVEKELRVLLPPLALEKPQSVRINLLFAGDSVGTVHVWNLDEELHRNPAEEGHEKSVLEALPSTVTSGSPTKTMGGGDYAATTVGVGSRKGVKTTRSLVQTAPVHSPGAAASSPKGKVAAGQRHPSGYVSAKPPAPHKTAHTEESSGKTTARKTVVVVPPVNLSRLDGISARSSPRLATPRMSSLQLLAAQRQGNVPRKVRTCDPVSQPKPTPKRRTLVTDHPTPPQEKSSGTDALDDALLQQYPSKSAKPRVVLDVPPLLPSGAGDGFHTPVKSRSSRQLLTSGSSKTPHNMETGGTPGNPSRRAALSPTPKSAASRSPGGVTGNSPVFDTPPNSPSKTTATLSSSSPSKASSRLQQRNASVSVGRKDTLPSSNRRRTTSTTTPLSTPARETVAAQSARSRALSTARSHASPSPRMPSSAKSASPSRRGPSTANQCLSRSAKCRIEFTGGVAVMGMATQYPPRITVTMRRIPDPMEQERSLLEDPDPLEVEKRSLENSFEELDEQKALFIFFQYLQLHLSVEGAVLNFRFLPQWTAKDSDGRQLFKQRDFSAVTKRFENDEEMPLEHFLILSGFHLHIKKLVLDAHSQPVCALHLDRKRRHLWAGRNDGLLSLFSVDNKYIVTRVPHPSATEAIGPPDPVEWMNQLQQYLKDSQFMTASRRLKKHKETMDFGTSARFSGFVPFCRTVQQSFAVVYQSREGSARGHGAVYPNMEVCLFDGRTNLSPSDRKHERHLNVFVNYLKMCRQNANFVRKAQREFFLMEEQRVAKSLDRLGRCHAGLFAGLIPLRQSFHLWKQHVEVFGFKHHARHQKMERQKMRISAAETILGCNKKNMLTLFFSKWKRWALLQRIEYGYRCIGNMIRFSQKRLRRPTSRMMLCLANTVPMKRIFRHWKQMILDQRRAAAIAPIIFSPIKNTEAQSLVSARLIRSAPSTSRERSFKNTWVDDEVEGFLHVLSSLYQARFHIVTFVDLHSHNIVEEAWLPVLQNAEAEASSDHLHDKKVSVLCYGLIPLLQGFLSSSDSVLANIHDPGVKEDVFSMMHGMLLCLDYILEDPEETLVELILSGKVSAVDYEENQVVPDSITASLMFRSDTALRGIMHYYLLSVVLDDESAASISEISKEIDSLQSLLSFIQANVNRS